MSDNDIQAEIDALTKVACSVPPRLAGKFLMKVAELKRRQLILKGEQNGTKCISTV